MNIELTDGELVLRPFRSEDIEPVHQAVLESFVEFSKWMQWCKKDYSKDDTSRFINSRDEAWQNDLEYGFGVFDRKTGVFQGSVGLSFVNRTYQLANLGYWIRTSATGRGIASSATRLVARFGFDELKLQRIEIVAAVDNIASQRVAEKAGAVREGVLRKRLVTENGPRDAVMFSLIAEDLQDFGVRQSIAAFL
jgi:RimJ/RimL family protein N-acetyltransferase